MGESLLVEKLTLMGACFNRTCGGLVQGEQSLWKESTVRINRLSILPTLVPSTSFSPSLSSSTKRVDYVFRECRSCRIMIYFIVDFLIAAIC